MTFNSYQFSRRFPLLECAVIIIHDKPKAGYRATGAAIVLPDGTVYCGVSVCSPKDQFVRATGRNKAIGRAFQEYRKEQPLAALGTDNWDWDLYEDGEDFWPSVFHDIRKMVQDEMTRSKQNASNRDRRALNFLTNQVNIEGPPF